ncbi:MAG: glucose-6-phosphate isomerase [Bacteroidia bacterium]|nr:glucose-6-phosphate isomerase [Bacteroidia bacterium]
MNTLPNINPTKTQAWKRLKSIQKELSKVDLKDLFKNDPERYTKFHIELEGNVFDYSKHFINQEAFRSLLDLADECKLDLAKEAVFSGSSINVTENRAVLHHALRNLSDLPIELEGEDVMPEVNYALAKMQLFTKQVLSKDWKGFTGKPIEHVVNIGIGGSDLGPVMVSEALKAYRTRLKVHFVSNVDPAHLGETLVNLDPETTLFIIASKTFTTQETMANAQLAKDWLVGALKSQEAVKRHFVAVSTNEKAVSDFGIDTSNMFGFKDWVGGRFSLWSSIGLSICLAVGYENFEELLEGAFVMDLHFKYSPNDRNIPVIMALLGIWYTNFWGCTSQAILPYSQYLHRFPAYLQQAEMESNGKSVDRNGKPVDYATCGVIWGEAGTNGQHAFYQLIHQGTQLIPSDFIGFKETCFDAGMNHMLLANFIAQTEALMNGKSREEVVEELRKSGKSAKEIDQLAPFKVFKGNKPSSSFLFSKLSPRSLGSLIAAYEHKIFVQGIIWNVYSYDQWGVELGKQLAGKILPEIKAGKKVSSHDASTNALIGLVL